ncbi:hypothetical protein QBC35DRAFT_477668 [Podospora australis]|uniref:Uncharacterized protein n=1 Tax=Podospora australis TaxID=1536484 RepID=A0AAN6WMF0_9PEZI|nr:hypothetical protein QBC35DRAFT_477668 [Podospora australis]
MGALTVFDSCFGQSPSVNGQPKLQTFQAKLGMTTYDAGNANWASVLLFTFGTMGCGGRGGLLRMNGEAGSCLPEGDRNSPLSLVPKTTIIAEDIHFSMQFNIQFNIHFSIQFSIPFQHPAGPPQKYHRSTMYKHPHPNRSTGPFDWCRCGMPGGGQGMTCSHCRKTINRPIPDTRPFHDEPGMGQGPEPEPVGSPVGGLINTTYQGNHINVNNNNGHHSTYDITIHQQLQDQQPSYQQPDRAPSPYPNSPPQSDDDSLHGLQPFLPPRQELQPFPPPGRPEPHAQQQQSLRSPARVPQPTPSPSLSRQLQNQPRLPDAEHPVTLVATFAELRAQYTMVVLDVSLLFLYTFYFSTQWERLSFTTNFCPLSSYMSVKIGQDHASIDFVAMGTVSFSYSGQGTLSSPTNLRQL